ncbi:MAG: hypothetical protein ACRD82_23630, partial [Blastocatellia bacterium]
MVCKSGQIYKGFDDGIVFSQKFLQPSFVRSISRCAFYKTGNELQPTVNTPNFAESYHQKYPHCIIRRVPNNSKKVLAKGVSGGRFNCQIELVFLKTARGR